MTNMYVQIEMEYEHWLTTVENGKTPGLSYKRTKRAHLNLHILLKAECGLKGSIAPLEA